MKQGIYGILRALARVIPHTPRMTVLFYHSVSDGSDFFAVSRAAFREQMAYLAQHCEVVPLARAFEHAAGKPVTRDSVAITFDDGYVDFAENALPVLREMNFPVTLFVLGADPDRRELGNEHPLLSQDGMRALVGEVEIGSHALTHRKLSKLPIEEAERELVESRSYIATITNTPPRYLAYPKGSFNRAVEEAAARAGYMGAVSVTQRGARVGDDLYALPRVQIDSSVTFGIFKAKLTQAADWYHTLWALVH